MPAIARKILGQLGRPEHEADSWPSDGEFSWPGGTMGTATPLFPRFDAEKKAALIARWLPDSVTAPPSAAPPSTTGGVAPAEDTASADGGAAAPPAPIEKIDFDRIDLRAATVMACERVPKTDKLLKLTLSIGAEQRTVVSGIAGAYAPETLVGRTVIYLANLKPAKIRGVLSQGMILAAGDSDVLALSTLDNPVPPGTRIR